MKRKTERSRSMLIETAKDYAHIAGTGRVSRNIFDYFASEVLERTDPEMQRFLLTNALLHHRDCTF
jgi:ATP/maltotriose-dependent transcriptional regulator MalT